MKLSLSLALLVAISAVNPARAADRTYAIGDFESIFVSGPETVTITTARATTVRATGDAASIDTLSVSVQDRTLRITPLIGNVSRDQKSRGPVTLRITVPKLSDVRVIGSGSVQIAEMRGLRGSIALIGSGTINLTRAWVDTLAVRLTGAGTITAAGTAKQADIDVKGAGSILAGALTVSDLKVTAASSGKIELSALRSASIRASGAGLIAVSGTATCTTENSGAGSVTCGRSR